MAVTLSRPHYAMVVSPHVVRVLHGYNAADAATLIFAGRDRRRVKREMRKAERRGRAEYDRSQERQGR